MANSKTKIVPFLVLLIISILIAISPIILAFIYFGLDYIGIMPLPGGMGALSFIMIFTVPAAVVIFIIGLLLIIFLKIPRKNIKVIKKSNK